MAPSQISLLLLLICWHGFLVLAKPAQKYSPGVAITPTETQPLGQLSGVIGTNVVDTVQTVKPAPVQTYVQPAQPQVVTYQQPQPVVYQRPQQMVYYQQQPQQPQYSQYPQYYQQPQYISGQQPYSYSTGRPSSSLSDVLFGGGSGGGSSSLSRPVSSALGAAGTLGALGALGTLGAGALLFG